MYRFLGIGHSSKGEKKRIMYRITLTLAAMLMCAVLASPAAINPIAYGSLTGTELITFDDVAGGAPPGTNHDSIFESGNTAFAERFVGETRTTSGDFDQLSGGPSSPIALQVGAAGQNINIVLEAGSQVLAGLGPAGFPNFNSIGEGSFALLFDFDQSEFGFQLVGGDGGEAFVSFYQRDGSLIETVTVSGLSTSFYGFQRDGGVQDIAGISVWNNDPGGIGIDNVKHDVRGVPDVPEPSTYAMLASGLAGLGLLRRKRT
jgi:hypothetical protein